MSEFKVGDWVVRLEAFHTSEWRAHIGKGYADPVQIVGLTGLGYLKIRGRGGDLDWGPSLFRPCQPPLPTNFNLDDYL